jgi:hypothetical protein
MKELHWYQRDLKLDGKITKKHDTPMVFFESSLIREGLSQFLLVCRGLLSWCMVNLNDGIDAPFCKPWIDFTGSS